MCDFLNYLWQGIKDLPYSSIADVLVAITSVVALWLSAKSYIRENENRKQDIKLQQWNALYPHRLEFYTDFYKTINKLLKLGKDIKQQTLDLAETKIPSPEMYDILDTLKKYTEEAEVLFNSSIQQKIQRVYDIFNDYISYPYKSRDKRIAKQQDEEWNTGLDNNRNNFKNFQETQKEIKKLKLEEQLKSDFESFLKLEHPNE